VSLAIQPDAMLSGGGLMSFLSPGSRALYQLGMTGGVAWQQHWWWTLFTATYLHGGLLHIAFNMLSLYRLMPTVSDCRVSQVVNIKKGIHCLVTKNPREAEDLERPTKETPKYLVSYVKDPDLNKAMDAASMGMIKMLEDDKKIARLDAYGLASVAMDCRVGAVSDNEKNVHCLVPKSIWVKQ